MVNTGGKGAIFYEKLQCVFIYPPDIEMNGQAKAISPSRSRATVDGVDTSDVKPLVSKFVHGCLVWMDGMDWMGWMGTVVSQSHAKYGSYCESTTRVGLVLLVQAKAKKKIESVRTMDGLDGWVDVFAGLVDVESCCCCCCCCCVCVFR